MRKVKFRAWDEYEEKFYYTTDSCDGFWFEFDDKGNFKFWVEREQQYSAGYEHPPEDVCEELEPAEQFTGLLDSRGKEVWEGDILKSYGTCFEIRWHETSACFYPIMKHMKVVGNIHQHPHLLEENK